MNNTPNSNRLHIGIFGKSNSGKSTLMNMITSQDVSIVSDKKGTTTDPVYKAMEISEVGPVLFVDTAGFDDNTELSNLREDRTEKVFRETDIAIIVVRDELDENLVNKIKSKNIPFFIVDNGSEMSKCDYKVVKFNRDEIINEIKNISSKISMENELLFGMLKGKETVLLVMPQDIQAPKGRLILPQVQTIRALLDLQCIVISTTLDRLEDSLNSIKNAPDLIITDSQIFQEVYKLKPSKSEITSFSVLMARQKSDIEILVEGAKVIDNLEENSKVLISEGCTHAPVEEDIGTVKIPNMLRKKVGENITIDFSRGVNFPKNIKDYDLVIMCGSCMHNRKTVMDRMLELKENGVAVTNYGIAIAKFKGILDKISY